MMDWEKFDFDVYESTSGKHRRYMVVPFGVYMSDEIEKNAKRFFKVSADDLHWRVGWVVGDDLWFDSDLPTKDWRKKYEVLAVSVCKGGKKS